MALQDLLFETTAVTSSAADTFAGAVDALIVCAGLLVQISPATLRDLDGDAAATGGQEGRIEYPLALFSSSFVYYSSSAILNFNICISWTGDLVKLEAFPAKTA